MKITRRQLRQMIMETVGPAGFSRDDVIQIRGTAASVGRAIDAFTTAARNIQLAAQDIKGGQGSDFPMLPIEDEAIDIAEKLREMASRLREFRAQWDWDSDDEYFPPIEQLE